VREREHGQEMPPQEGEHEQRMPLRESDRGREMSPLEGEYGRETLTREDEDDRETPFIKNDEPETKKGNDVGRTGVGGGDRNEQEWGISRGRRIQRRTRKSAHLSRFTNSPHKDPQHEQTG